MEFTPNSYVQGDLGAFFANFSPSIKGTSLILISIDGGETLLVMYITRLLYCRRGLPTPDTPTIFGDNGESDLDFVRP